MDCSFWSRVNKVLSMLRLNLSVVGDISSSTIVTLFMQRYLLVWLTNTYKCKIGHIKK